MRPLYLLVAGLMAVLAGLGTLPAQAEKSAPARNKDAPIVSHCLVLYRAKSETNWTTFGHYTSQASARHVWEHLARSGKVTRLVITNEPLPKLPPRPVSGLLPASETYSLEKVTEVFAWMARQKDIAFKFPVDGCYARAQLMCERMMRNKFKPRKIWAASHGENLFAKTKNHPKGYVTWGYHVAPVLRVRNADGTQRWYVLDPSLFTQPATVTQWEQAMMKTPKGPRPYLTISKIGEGPVWFDKKRRPGTGYWPGADPKEGPSAHAVATMKKYKPWEGKDMPRTGMGWLPGWEGRPGEYRTAVAAMWVD